MDKYAEIITSISSGDTSTDDIAGGVAGYYTQATGMEAPSVEQNFVLADATTQAGNQTVLPDNYTGVISQINSATSLQSIQNIVGTYSAQAVGSGGILYSGNVGGVQAQKIALNIIQENAQNGVTTNIIDNTPRGLLLADTGVAQAIMDAAKAILNPRDCPCRRLKMQRSISSTAASTLRRGAPSLSLLAFGVRLPRNSRAL